MGLLSLDFSDMSSQTAIFVVALLYDEESHAPLYYLTIMLCESWKVQEAPLNRSFVFFSFSFFISPTYYYKNPWMVMNEELKNFPILVLFRKQFLFLVYKKHQKMPYVSTVLWSCTFEKWDISSLEWDEVV